jgi:hypothetical protein
MLPIGISIAFGRSIFGAMCWPPWLSIFFDVLPLPAATPAFPLHSLISLAEAGGYIGVTLLGTQRPSKTELVAIRVGQVKESLAPFGISRGCVRPIPRRDYAPIERINV